VPSDSYALYYAVALPFFAYAAFATFRLADWPRLDRLVVALGLMVYFFKPLWFWPNGSDFRIFHAAGATALAGDNPYLDPLFLNPPPGLPLVEMFAWADDKASFGLWTMFNLVAGLLLVPIAWRAVSPRTPFHVVAVWSVAVGLSIPMHFTLTLGQLSVWTALFGILGMYLADRNPLLAGVAVGLAAVKPQNALPLMLRFARGRSLLAWLSAGAVVLFLTLLSGPVDQLKDRIATMLGNVSALAVVGGMNDFSDLGPHAHTIIGFDRLVWCLGVHDRSRATIIAFALIAVVGLVLFVANARGKLDGPTAAALACMYAMVFLYHRTHDALILALPLVYCAGRFREFRRPAHGVAFGCLMLIMVIHPRALQRLAEKVPSFATEAILLPLPTTLLLAAGVLIFVEATRRGAISPVVRPAICPTDPR